MLKEIFNLSEQDFNERFNKELDCLEYVAHKKWEDGFECRKCGHTHYCDGKVPFSRRCTKCKAQETAKSNTVFHSCKLPLNIVFEIMYYIWNNEDCKSSELHEKFKIRQMTCWKFQNLVKEIKHQSN